MAGPEGLKLNIDFYLWIIFRLESHSSFLIVCCVLFPNTRIVGCCITRAFCFQHWNFWPTFHRKKLSFLLLTIHSSIIFPFVRASECGKNWKDVKIYFMTTEDLTIALWWLKIMESHSSLNCAVNFDTKSALIWIICSFFFVRGIVLCKTKSGDNYIRSSDHFWLRIK